MQNFTQCQAHMHIHHLSILVLYDDPHVQHKQRGDSVSTHLFIHFEPNKPYLFEPGHEKMCLMSFANNKGADQPAHPRSLISASVVRCLDSIISLDSIAEISGL